MRLGSSFRDPAGHMFRHDGRLYREVSPSYAPTLDLLVQSGLYKALVQDKRLIAHEEVAPPLSGAVPGTRYLAPEQLKVIGYPYEWCFGQLKAAALATLEIQARALDHGMTLKDASAYNIQFHEGSATLIDTLSFERYDASKPWRAYRQFCEHFLAPLALMSLVDVRLGKLLSTHLDGIPLTLASRVLPRRTRLHPGLAMHIHLHAKLQNRGSAGAERSQARFNERAMRGLIDSLRRTCEGLHWRPEGTVWGDYYDETNYSGEAMRNKRLTVERLLHRVQPKPAIVWDLGANTGEFSEIAAAMGVQTVAWDVDYGAVEKCYRKHAANALLLPLVTDLTNPSPALGWAHRERDSMQQRANAQCAMALALIHHLAIGNNVPLSEVASFFATLAPWLIVEFVPKSDSQVQRLLSTREDVYDDYTEEGFRQAFERSFIAVDRVPVEGSQRVIYLYQRKAQA